MAVNEVIYNGQTLMSLRGDTVTANDMARGVTAHNEAGERITGLAAKIEMLNASSQRSRNSNKPTYNL